MKKFALAAFAVFFFWNTPPVFAEETPFDISMKTEYRVQESAVTSVIQTISIKNLTDYTYTPTYAITLGNDDLRNVSVTDSSGPIPFDVISQDEGKKIEIIFPRKHVGKNVVNSFTINYDTNDFAQKRGRVWEISIPGIADPDSFSDLSTMVYTPDSFGKASIMKPNVASTETNPITFSKKDTASAGVFILFGDSQLYTYRLIYHISNSNLFPVITEIALPPATAYQDVTVNNLQPKPMNVYRDGDGNWLAEYRLSPSQKLDIIAAGEIEVRSVPQGERLNTKKIEAYTNVQEYWEVNDPKIQKIAREFSSPKEIYDYTVSNFSYNYDKVSQDNDRLGALKVINDPTNAVCLEFTDVFVALARASGIPARAHEGYAYTSDEKLRPLSLVEDVLHAWPEYYDSEKESWVMVDPTWGNTTKGLDYFDSFDYDHITFVIKGLDSNYPVPAGGYKFDKKSRDVSIEFSTKEHLSKKYQAALVSTFPEEAISALPISGNVIIKNTGNTPITGRKVELSSELPLKQTVYEIDYIPPFGQKVLDVEFKNTPILTNENFTITMLFEGISQQKTIAVRIIPVYGIFLITGVIICAGIIITILTIKSRRVPLQEPEI